MILPIVAYGCQVLRTKATAVDQNDPELKSLISNMWETMYEANGVGIAAPQVGVSKRLFVIDAAPFAQDEELSPEEAKVLEGFKKCLSIPLW